MRKINSVVIVCDIGMFEKRFFGNKMPLFEDRLLLPNI